MVKGGEILVKTNDKYLKKSRRGLTPLVFDNLDMLSPYDLLRNLRYELDQLEHGFGNYIWGNKWSHPPNLLRHLEFPHIDIFNEDDKLKIAVEITGSSKENIQLDIGEDNLRIHAKTKLEKRVEGAYIVQFREQESEFTREVSLPIRVVPDEATAIYKNDILEIEVPKKKMERKSIRINIK